MTFEELNNWMTKLAAGERVPAAMRHTISSELPAFIRALDPHTAPKRLRLPSGESLQDATRMTALKCHCLLLARKVHGADFLKADPQYEILAKDLLFWVMRHNFNTGDPKGIFCCAACSISLLPLYALACFRWVDCKQLKSEMLAAAAARRSVFRSNYPKAYFEWASAFVDAG
jgi:hypothetical protein